ncbi:MAG: NAD(P)-binding domain-containing protein [bacterium]
MKILIIGNGQIGSAIFHLLKENKQKKTIEIYDRDELKNDSGKTLKECLENTDYVFLCIPSWHLEKALKDISIHLKNNTILISLSKGIDMTSGKSVDQLIEKSIKKAKFTLLSGPMFAREIIENKMSFAVSATADKKVFNKVAELFENTKLKLEYSNKVHSVAISGVLKNIYTLAISIIDNSIEDNNIKGFLSAKAVREMEEIMKILKLDEETIYGTSGLGDFIATVSSRHSQNRKVGEEISDNGSTALLSEGLVSLPSIVKLLGKKSKKLPLLSLLEKIIKEKKNPKNEIGKFLKEIK